MEAANHAPSGVVAPAQNPQAASSGTVPPQNTNSSTASNSTQSTAQSANVQATPAAPTGNSGSQTATSNEAQQQNAGTTPRIRQTQPGETQENGQQLPATSTILPLLGLIGLASGGLGLWFRKSRK